MSKASKRVTIDEEKAQVLNKFLAASQMDVQ